MAGKLWTWIWWAPLLIAGCAQTVEVTSSTPAPGRSPREQRIAVLDVDGPEEYAKAATQRLVQRLRQSGVYQVFTEEALRRAAPESLRDSNGRLRKHVAGAAGRRMRLNALLVASLKTRDSRTEGALRFGHPVVSVTTMYHMVELPSGRIVDTGQAQHGEAVRGGGYEPIGECVKSSIDELTLKLAPNLSTRTVQLAGNSWFGDLSDGIQLAAGGDWRAAEASWQAVARDAPDNDEAWYNLGIAAEARGDHRSAHQRFRRAVELDNREEYQLAFQRIDDLLVAQQIARRQMPRPERQSGGRRPPRYATRPAAYVPPRR